MINKRMWEMKKKEKKRTNTHHIILGGKNILLFRKRKKKIQEKCKTMNISAFGVSNDQFYI